MVTSDRAAVAQFYRRYRAANLVPSEWTGDVPSCNAGTTGSDYKEATRQQINFFRAMVGVPASVSIDATFSAKDQSAALIMSANGQLSHSPPSSWNCYSASGAEAAGKSNLALGSSGPAAVTGFMNDSGSRNAFVGHRRWVLYPQTQLMGTGDVTNRASGGLESAGSSSLKLTGLAPGSATITVTDTGNNKASLTATVSAAASASDWQIAGRADGVAEAMTLVADVLPASLDDGRPGAYFVAAVLPNGLIFVNVGQTWQSYAGGNVPSRLTGPLTQRSFPVFTGFDTRGLTGTRVLVGYGADSDDMLNNARYQAIYTIP